MICSVKKRRELWGESVREIGVLLIVFVPLDGFFDGAKPLSTLNLFLYAGIGLVLVLAGTEIERNGI